MFATSEERSFECLQLRRTDVKSVCNFGGPKFSECFCVSLLPYSELISNCPKEPTQAYILDTPLTNGLIDARLPGRRGHMEASSGPSSRNICGGRGHVLQEGEEGEEAEGEVVGRKWSWREWRRAKVSTCF